MDPDSEPLPLAPLAAALGPAPVLSGDAAPVGWWQAWRRRSAGSLPLLGMAMLAALSWWLVKQAPKAEGPPRIDAPTHTVDYEMRGFSVRHQGGHGLAGSLVQGEQAQHYADDDTLEIAGVYLRSSDALGRVTEAWAERAQADAQGRQLVLQGRARVRRSASAGGGLPIEFSSEWLAVDTQTERMHTDRPVTLVQGPQRFEAGGLDYDHARDELVLSGPVRGHIEMVRP